MKYTHIPGDERSRTNPGHGYPATTETNTQLEVFETEEEWKSHIKQFISPAFGQAKGFRAFIIEPVSVTVSVDLEVVKTNA
jgi:hypothetical protein